MAISPQKTETPSLSIQTTTTVPMQIIADIMITAIETPVQQWCLGVYARNQDMAVVTEGPWYADPKFWAQDGWSITVLEDLNDDGDKAKAKVHTITIEDIKQGLHLMADKYPSHLVDIVGENSDADDADLFLQLVVLKDEVYA